MKVNFSNLAEFFDLFEFCPFCGKRTVPVVVAPSGLKCEVTNELLIANEVDTNNPKLSLGIKTNKIHVAELIRDCENRDIYCIVVGKRCNKFHFVYSGSCYLYVGKLCIVNVELDKIHFLRSSDEEYFSVNNFVRTNLTYIYMTKDQNTRELRMPLVDFNFASKKQIDNQLKIIQILG